MAPSQGAVRRGVDLTSEMLGASSRTTLLTLAGWPRSSSTPTPFFRPPRLGRRSPRRSRRCPSRRRRPGGASQLRSWPSPWGSNPVALWMAIGSPPAVAEDAEGAALGVGGHGDGGALAVTVGRRAGSADRLRPLPGAHVAGADAEGDDDEQPATMVSTSLDWSWVGATAVAAGSMGTGGSIGSSLTQRASRQDEWRALPRQGAHALALLVVLPRRRGSVGGLVGGRPGERSHLARGRRRPRLPRRGADGAAPRTRQRRARPSSRAGSWPAGGGSSVGSTWSARPVAGPPAARSSAAWAPGVTGEALAAAAVDRRGTL